MVLENKLGINESAELARQEERISKKKALELFEKGILNSLEAGKFASLAAIHKYLFEAIYTFAGEIRAVNLAEGNFFDIIPAFFNISFKIHLEQYLKLF